VIQELDLSLTNFLKGEARPGSELDGATISFAVPNKEWRDQGAGLQLNVYLYKVMDNRSLRSNERRLRTAADGSVTLEQFPARLECSYLISAWNKGAVIAAVEREKQEHRLLSQVLYVLWRHPTLPRPYLTPALASQEIDLPVVAAEAEDTGAMPDFWSGLETYLRPSITCKVTLGLDLARDVSGLMVSAAAVGFGGQGEEFFIIGGTVREAAPPGRGVAGAWVRVNETGRVYVTDRDGRFRIDRIARGAYTLTVRAVGFQEGQRPAEVPLPGGVYDVSLVPL
jgi:hypothetical protein